MISNQGIYNHDNKVFMECKALKEAATSLSTHDNLLYNPVFKKLKILVLGFLYFKTREVGCQGVCSLAYNICEH